MRKNVENLVAVALVCLPLLAIAGVGLPYAFGLSNLSILGLYLAVPMLVVPVAVLGIRNRTPRIPLERMQIDWRLYSIGFHLILAVMFLTLSGQTVRPRIFFVGLSLLYVILVCLTFVSHESPTQRVISLYHVVITFLVTTFSVTLRYDFFIGRTDLTAHIAMANTIVETGALTDAEPYVVFQLWHIYTATSTHLFGGYLTPHRTMYLLNGLIYAGGIVAVYAFSRRIVPDDRVAILSSIVVIAYPMYLFYGLYSIPRSVTSIFFLLLLVTLISRSTPRFRLLEYLLILAMVAYHPVTIPYVFITLVILAGVETALRSRRTIVRTDTLAVVFVFTATYWLYRAEFLVVRIVNTLIASLTTPSDEPTPAGVEASPWAEMANYIPYSFFVLFILIGVLLWIHHRSSVREPFAVIAIATVVLLPFTLPGPMLLLDSLAGMNIARFTHYTFMFLAVTGGFGLHQLLVRGGVELLIVVLLLVSVFGFTAVSNDFVASDNPTIERPFYTYYLTDHERQSFETIDAISTNELVADRPTARYLTEMHDRETGLLATPVTTNDTLEGDGIIIRHEEAKTRPLQLTQYTHEEELEPHLIERDKVYDSGSVAYYR